MTAQSLIRTAQTIVPEMAMNDRFFIGFAVFYAYAYNGLCMMRYHPRHVKGFVLCKGERLSDFDQSFAQ